MIIMLYFYFRCIKVDQANFKRENKFHSNITATQSMLSIGTSSTIRYFKFKYKKIRAFLKNIM